MNSRFIDLSHIIKDGLKTYKGFESVHICDYWSRKMSAKNYRERSSFQIKLTMLANSRTYLDAPFHRLEAGDAMPQLNLEPVAEIPAYNVEVANETRQLKSPDQVVSQMQVSK